MDVTKENVQNIYPLSPTQEGMLFHHLAAEDPEAYIQQISYRVRGPLDARIFEAAWNEVIRRHDILRTALVHHNTKRPVQVVLKQHRLDLTVHDITNLDAPAQESFLHASRARDRHIPFEPAAAKLMRVALIRLHPEEHEVIWTHHHIITDGWSIGILQNELVEIYRALAAGLSVNLPAAPPYSRYIRHLESLDHDASAHFWREYLDGYARPAAIPPTTSGAAPKRIEEHMIQLDAAALESLARECSVTLNTVLQTAWAILLSRYCGSPDVVFGAVVSGRPPQVPGIDRMAGIFVNAIPVRVRPHFSSRFDELLRQVQTDAIAREPHQYFPLAKAQAQSALKHNLIATVTAMENYPVERQIQATQLSLTLGYSVDHVRVSERTHYDFLVQFLPGEALAVKFQYNAALHTPTAIKQLAAHFETLLATVTQHPSVTVAGLHRAISAAHAPIVTARFEAIPVHRRIEAQASANPTSVAITCERDSITYAELNARANRLARHLQSLGVTRETRVGICCERSIGLIVSMLAVLKAGGAYVPMDPAYPPDRLAFLLSDSAAHVVIADQTGAAALAQHRTIVSPNSGADLPSHNLDTDPIPAQSAYIIYTSGSTGRPKGCVVSVENVSRLFTATEQWFHFGPADTWTMFHSAAFDFSVWEIWGALVHGGRLVIVPYWLSRSPDDFASLLESERVTVLNQTPSAFRQLLAAGFSRRAPNLSLRLVIFGGEALNLQSLTPWFDTPLAHRAQLVNMYGITETTVHVTYRVITNDDVTASRGSMIGVPIGDLSVQLLDPLHSAVPIGATGEIHVGGAGVARGYWMRPALTAERFLPDPAGPPGSRIYRSGDLARATGTHDTEYLGRADEQVKIRGFRIELGEIESVLSSHPAVREALVTAYDAGEEKRLAAYVAGPSIETSLDDLRALLKTNLPAYMIPGAIIPLEKFPLTTHGKIDRKALPAPGISTTTTRIYTPPTNSTEEALASTWSQVLGVPQIGIHDNYLELGGDSITAIRIVSALLQRQLKIGVRDLFRFPTIAELAPHVQTAEARPQSKRLISQAPLAPIQHQFLTQHTIHPHWFNHAVFISLPTHHSPERLRIILQQAWQALWTHHDALRLRFVHTHGTWTQELTSQPCPAIEYNTSAAPPSFNLTTGPLLQLTLVESPQAARLLIVLHHLIVDAVSWRILLADFITAFRQAEAGQPIALPDATASFLTWCTTLDAHRASPHHHATLPYWREIEDHPVTLEILASNTYGDAETRSVPLATNETSDLLKNASTAYNTTTEELLLAALSIALGQWTATPATKILLESHGRAEDLGLDVSRTIGWFTSIYPVLLACADPTSTAHIIKHTKETLRKVPRLGLDYGIWKSTAPRTGPQAAIRFNYLGAPETQIPAATDFAVTTEATPLAVSPSAQRPVALDFSAIVLNNQMQLSITYNRRQFSEDEILRLLSLYRQSLETVIGHCCGQSTSEVTPSDLTYNDLSLDEFDRMLL